ncbi:MAG: glycosyltransferase family 4 protein [Verrucomicrobia bacterium]|nr:glycosyltransferase family 4 protein [Verrucomicrobiota bacterium]
MTAPLRILQVNSRFAGGGTDNQTLELTAGLRDLGVQVRLSIPEGTRWLPLARELGVPVHAFPARSSLMQAAIRQWRSVIRAHRIQIIHVHQGRDYWPAIMAARLAACGTRIVITRHLMTRPRRFTRWFLLSMADVVAVSNAVLDVLKQELHGPLSRLHLIYGGIDTAKFHPVRTPAALDFRRQQGWEPDHVVFGVVGAFDLPRGKGQLELLDAACRLRAEFPHARYAIIGQGSMESLLRERITTLGLEQAVRIVPFTEKIATVLSALDVLTHPAVGAEALGLVIWEGMSCGKPVIASRLHGIPEAFVEGEHGFLVPPGDAGALAEAMRALLTDPVRCRRFGEAGRRHIIRHFSREILARQVNELYCGLLTNQ